MAGLRSSIVPELIAALVDQLATATSAEVTTGLSPAIMSGDHLGVGVPDPEATRPATAATSQIGWATSVMAGGFDESGEISLAATSANGSDDLAEAVGRVYQILADIITHLRASWSAQDLLGVAGLWDLHPASTELVTYVDDNGCVAYLLIRLAYQARI